jgi:arylsulfatase A-like enzyme
MARRPNFLLIITDQHRADYLGCAGHPVLRTPHIDRLAERGVRFERFYVASPVCMPNRASLMTGRLPSLHGVRSNGIPLSVQANTFVEALRDAGYRTALIGKSHLQTMTGIPPIYGRAIPAGLTLPNDDAVEALKPYASPDAYEQENRPHWRNPDHAVATPFYGFDRVRLCIDHGDIVGGDYSHWLRSKGFDPAKLQGRANALPSNAVCPQAWRTAIPEELYPTSYVAEQTIATLDDWSNAGTDDPFFLMMSFPDPHHPFTPPGRYWDMYDPADAVLPESFYAAPSDAKPIAMAYRHGQADQVDRETTPKIIAIDEREAKEAVALTCGMISMIDDAVGRVVKRLTELGLKDETIIIFTSDHGDLLGDHRLLLKGPVHLQSVVRVPFIWSEPGATAARIDQSLASTLDIPVSVLTRAGLAGPNGMQGHDLNPRIAAKAASRQSCAIVEEESPYAVLGLSAPVRCRSVVTDDWRLTLYEDESYSELYDLKNDPAEMHNLWGRTEYRDMQAKLLEAMARQYLIYGDVSPMPTYRA